ncbi:MAG: RNA polymerase-associated protein RapA [Candidatus Anoxychlamydiales bacterium]|nr:RNA polymerase-associated protein RapA [Candidatus Anoxychlamydiales bacterium]
MFNFRKLKLDFSPNLLKEGKQIFDKKRVVTAKILKLDSDIVRFSAKVVGKYENTYESEIEVDRFESETIHSNCDCTHKYDCQHIAALIFYLEDNIDSILLNFSKDSKVNHDIDSEIKEKIQIAEIKVEEKKDKHLQKQILQEYVNASNILSTADFFLATEDNKISNAELSFIFNPKSLDENQKFIDFTLALRLPGRSKPLNVPNVRTFLEALRYIEPIILGSKKYFFSIDAFNDVEKMILNLLLFSARFNENLNNERAQRIAKISIEDFGTLLSKVHEIASKKNPNRSLKDLSEDLPELPSIFISNLENPLSYSFSHSKVKFDLHYLNEPSKVLLNPSFIADQNVINIKEAKLFECASPGMIYERVYYKFDKSIKRAHLKKLDEIRDMTIPEALFGTFVENSLPELQRFARVDNLDVINRFITLPYTKNLSARCSLSYLEDELEATLYFIYEDNEIKSSSKNLNYDSISKFITEEGIVARNLVSEKKIIEELFQDFVFNPEAGVYVSKSEKKIVEFMTEIIPKNQDRIKFECPQNLLDQFVYDETKFTLDLDVSEMHGHYKFDLKVEGDLKGVKFDLIFDCVAANRSFIELAHLKKRNNSRFSKILVLDLEKIEKIVNVFDEIGIKKITDHKENRPLWSIIAIEEKLFKDLPIKFSISKKLLDIKKSMLGLNKFNPSAIPSDIKADLREYQKEGVYYLERLRGMYLNGLLADDMGLGKTLQAIIAISQIKTKINKPSIVVCPTSLLYNWKEELHKFNPKLKAVIIEGVPQNRKKIISTIKNYDVIITSYTLMQKDIDQYKDIDFAYTILDEAQHIKNRATRNAKSVKEINSTYKLILTGTPIENSLDELWSLFDFLMPSFLSTFDRFSERYLKQSSKDHSKNLEHLKKKISPFILRRMKEDVLKDLPPVSEIDYHCKLEGYQLELYRSYAQEARQELTKLVNKQGYHKVQIHVLATLTRLKQICCHPAIFAKEKAEVGDSAKYEMLQELISNLIDGNHKTVIFSQYTKMLQIMKEDFKERGINYSYLDGATKNRLEIVKEFNENKDIPIFLVSLKAGGVGLNITGADTVIHYDMWWNPAVENQATDRVHRIGQKKSVSAYKLITVNSIEEKIVEMQKRKKGLVKKIIACDDEAITKLTWDEVLELLQI